MLHRAKSLAAWSFGELQARLSSFGPPCRGTFTVISLMLSSHRDAHFNRSNHWEGTIHFQQNYQLLGKNFALRFPHWSGSCRFFADITTQWTGPRSLRSGNLRALRTH